MQGFRNQQLEPCHISLIRCGPIPCPCLISCLPSYLKQDLSCGQEVLSSSWEWDRASEPTSHSLGGTGSCLWICRILSSLGEGALSWAPPRRKRQVKKIRWHKGCLSQSREKRIASHSPPGSGLGWQLSTSGIKSAFNSSSASPAATDTASTPAVSQATVFSKCPWLAPSSIESVNGQSQLTPQRSWSHTPINFYGAKCK